MQANSKEKSTRLIAFAVSHYCEKALRGIRTAQYSLSLLMA